MSALLQVTLLAIGQVGVTHTGFSSDESNFFSMKELADAFEKEKRLTKTKNNVNIFFMTVVDAILQLKSRFNKKK